MDAEPEQLHAVFAIEACCVVAVPGGDLGDQAYLVRSGACTAVTPRHGPPHPCPTPAQFYGFTCRSVQRGLGTRFQYEGRAPEKTCRPSEPIRSLIP